MALLNTHATVKKFVHFGLSEDQAEAITEAINEQNQELATKSDLAILRSDMNSMKAELKSEITLVESNLRAEIALVQSNLKSEISEVRSEIKNLGTELRADIRTLRADGIWLKGILLIILGLLVKLTFFNG